jgi:hypothetical protein
MRSGRRLHYQSVLSYTTRNRVPLNSQIEIVPSVVQPSRAGSHGQALFNDHKWMAKTWTVSIHRVALSLVYHRSNPLSMKLLSLSLVETYVW